MAEWQSGHAVDCKSIYLGSTPGSASIFFSCIVKIRPGGGIGRHKGFKIPRFLSVTVQVRLRAPIQSLKHFGYGQRVKKL